MALITLFMSLQARPNADIVDFFKYNNQRENLSYANDVNCGHEPSGIFLHVCLACTVLSSDLQGTFCRRIWCGRSYTYRTPVYRCVGVLYTDAITVILVNARLRTTQREWIQSGTHTVKPGWVLRLVWGIVRLEYEKTRVSANIPLPKRVQ